VKEGGVNVTFLLQLILSVSLSIWK